MPATNLTAVLAVVMVLSASDALPRESPPPPAKLHDCIAILSQIDKCLEGGDWEEARRHSDRLQVLFNALVGQQPREGDRNMMYNFGYALGAFQTSLGANNRRQAEGYYIDLNSTFLSFASRFEFSLPPALAAIDELLGQVRNQATEGSYEEVIYELRGIGRYLRDIYDILQRQGAASSQIWGFHHLINQAMAAAEINNDEYFFKALTRMAEDIEVFKGLFSSPRQSKPSPD